MKNKENKFSIKKISSVAILFLFIVSYLLLVQVVRSEDATRSISIHLNSQISATIIRGIITQLQMILCVSMVLFLNQWGYLFSLLLNFYSMLGAIIFLIYNGSSDAIPGVLSYIGVLLICTIIFIYKKRVTENLRKIEKQKLTLIQSENQLKKMVFYDMLTNLPNKSLFVDRLNQSIELSKRKGFLIGVLFVDLDAFKSVNDTMGHAAGDMVLVEIGTRFSKCLRKEDTVSRFGGDEFLIQINNIEKVEDLKLITDKILNTLSQPVCVNEVHFMITASIGCAVYPYDGADSDTLIKNADIAMYTAKARGINEVIYCTTDMKNDVLRKMKLTNKLYRALEQNELFVQYQPQVNTKTKKIIGFEALLRWKNEEFGLIPPDVFIPLAETTGIIKSIGLWVFETVCIQCKGCTAKFGENYRVSINLSLEQLKDVNFIEQISKILKDTKVNPQNIQIEVTESVAFKEETFVLNRLKEMKDLGLTISIDDFGTGHSSLSRLRTYPIDLIKIDMEFIQGITLNSKKEKEIVKSIIQLAKNLDMGVLAEGVETEEQYEFLNNEDCDEIQGFYFYKPMNPEDIVELILCKEGNTI